MAQARDEILDWVEQGRIAPGRLRAALEAGAVLPTSNEWRGFVERLLLWLGVVSLAAGLIFFLAYNWQDLGRTAKLALAQAAIVIALAFVWRLGLDQAAGKAALLAAALLVGALLALIGQIYQTGADTFELFAAWAAAIVPWVLLGRFPALWILWLALVNLALPLYFLTFGILWGMLFAPEKLLWLLFGLNTVALAAWEAAAAAGISWLRERWSVRILASASGAFVTALALYDIVDWRESSRLGVPVWLAWLAAAHFCYRRRIRDIFVLAGGVLSAIAVASTFLARHLVKGDPAFAFLLIGVIVIGMSAAGGWWLKNVANEEES